LESCEAFGIVSEMIGQKFQRNVALQLNLVSSARNTMPMPPSLSGDLISYSPMRLPVVKLMAWAAYEHPN